MTAVKAVVSSVESVVVTNLQVRYPVLAVLVVVVAHDEHPTGNPVSTVVLKIGKNPVLQENPELAM